MGGAVTWLPCCHTSQRGSANMTPRYRPQRPMLFNPFQQAAAYHSLLVPNPDSAGEYTSRFRTPNLQHQQG